MELLMRNHVLKVLATLTSHQVQYLLMGGQACVFYGGTEFSRDTDVVIAIDADNLNRLTTALAELQATVIAVPPYEVDYLNRGFAVHFQCQRADVFRMRVDVMAVMRGVDSFANLWMRRSTFAMPDGQEIELMGVADLVKAKKTQRDKDWPMIRALIEAHYENYRQQPTAEQTLFWLAESRTPELLMQIASDFPQLAIEATQQRGLVNHAISGDKLALNRALAEEQALEGDKDRRYWEPLRAELEQIRVSRKRRGQIRTDDVG